MFLVNYSDLLAITETKTIKSINRIIIGIKPTPVITIELNLEIFTVKHF